MPESQAYKSLNFWLVPRMLAVAGVISSQAGCLDFSKVM